MEPKVSDHSEVSDDSDEIEYEILPKIMFIFSQKPNKIVINAVTTPGCYSTTIKSDQSVFVNDLIDALRKKNYQTLLETKDRLTIKVLEETIDFYDITWIPADKLKEVRNSVFAFYPVLIFPAVGHYQKPVPPKLPEFADILIAELLAQTVHQEQSTNQTSNWEVCYIKENIKILYSEGQIKEHYEHYDKIEGFPDSPSYLKLQQLMNEKKIKNSEKRLSNPNHPIYFQGCPVLEIDLHSNIAVKVWEVLTLSHLFQRQISLRLVYCASQNNFQVEKFYQKAENVANTLILVKTQFGNKIGAFTPLVWEKSDQIKTKTDTSNQSFVFQITTKYKNPIKTTQLSGIRMQKNMGPGFGDDLQIVDLANTQESTGKIGQSYENMKKTNFKIEEWETWEIVFA